MQEVFEKIIDKLEAYKDVMLSPNNFDCFGEECKYNDCMVCIFAKAIEIVKQEAEQYNNGWISCSESLPEEYGSYLVAWKTIPMIDRIHTHFYEILEFDPDDEALWTGIIRQANGLEYEIIAWMPLPEPYNGNDKYD